VYTDTLLEHFPKDIVSSILLKYIGENDFECAKFVGLIQHTMRLYGVKNIEYNTKEKVMAFSFDFVPVSTPSFYIELTERFMVDPKFSYQQYTHILMGNTDKYGFEYLWPKCAYTFFKEKKDLCVNDLYTYIEKADYIMNPTTQRVVNVHSTDFIRLWVDGVIRAGRWNITPVTIDIKIGYGTIYINPRKYTHTRKLTSLVPFLRHIGKTIPEKIILGKRCSLLGGYLYYNSYEKVSEEEVIETKDYIIDEISMYKRIHF